MFGLGKKPQFNVASLGNMAAPLMWHGSPQEESFLSPEATDPYILRQLTESFSAVIHEDSNVPKGFDAALVAAYTAINGDTEKLRRAAVLEMLCWIRRVSYLTNTLSRIIHFQAEVVGNKAADFPQAEELSTECRKIYDDNMSAINPAVKRINDSVFGSDLSEILGIKQHIRESLASMIPHAE